VSVANFSRRRFCVDTSPKNIYQMRVLSPFWRSKNTPVQKAVHDALLLKYSARAGLPTKFRAKYFELWVLRIFLHDVFVLTRQHSKSTESGYSRHFGVRKIHPFKKRYVMLFCSSPQLAQAFHPNLRQNILSCGCCEFL